MAPSFKVISLLFLFAFLASNALARESMFFNKVSTTTINPTENKNTTVSSTGAESTSKPEEEPAFTQDTQNDSYGLYAGENSQDPASTVAGESFYADQVTSVPFQYQTGHNAESNTGAFSESNADSVNNEDNKLYDNSYQQLLQHQKEDDKYVQESLEENGGSSDSVDANQYDVEFADKKQQKEEDDLVNSNLQGMPYKSSFDNNNYGYGQQEPQKEDKRVQGEYIPETTDDQGQDTVTKKDEQQGLSDTKFLDHGRYYYDPQNEQKYNQQGNQYDASVSGYKYNNEQVTGYERPTGNFQNQEPEYYPHRHFLP